jgi:hypothetical protein
MQAMRCSSLLCQWHIIMVGSLIAGSAPGAAADDTRFFQPIEAAAPLWAADDSDDGDAVKTAAITEAATGHPLQPAIHLARSSLAAMETITDYEATLVKEERLKGKLIKQTMQIRLRESPFSVYLRFGGDVAGREILYVQGKYNNQLQAREGSGLKSLVGTVSLAADGIEAMQENRRPITTIGMRRMLQSVLAQWEEETRYGEVNVKFYPNARLGDRSCQVIESSHPHRRRQFPFHMTRLFIDVETRLPVRVEQYGYPTMPGATPPLEELYSYSDIRTNIGLSDIDFSKDNPEYGF